MVSTTIVLSPFVATHLSLQKVVLDPVRSFLLTDNNEDSKSNMSKTRWKIHLNISSPAPIWNEPLPYSHIWAFALMSIPTPLPGIGLRITKRVLSKLILHDAPQASIQERALSGYLQFTRQVITQIYWATERTNWLDLLVSTSTLPKIELSVILLLAPGLLRKEERAIAHSHHVLNNYCCMPFTTTVCTYVPLRISTLPVSRIETRTWLVNMIELEKYVLSFTSLIILRFWELVFLK